jgi:hypothetical protein
MYDNGKYTSGAWHATALEKITLTQDSRPACPGEWRRLGGGCSARPDHIVVFSVNESGLPGLGTRYEYHVCYRHLHSLVKHAESVGGCATVSAYDGV